MTNHQNLCVSLAAIMCNDGRIDDDLLRILLPTIAGAPPVVVTLLAVLLETLATREEQLTLAISKLGDEGGKVTPQGRRALLEKKALEVLNEKIRKGPPGKAILYTGGS